MKTKHVVVVMVLLALGYLLVACGPAANLSLAQGDHQFVGIVQSIDNNQWKVDGQVFTVSDTTKIDGNVKVGDLVKLDVNVSSNGAATVAGIKAAPLDAVPGWDGNGEHETRTPESTEVGDQHETATPESGETHEPTETPRPTEAHHELTETPHPTEQHHESTATARPTEQHREPTNTPHPTEKRHEPSETPRPTEHHEPSETPQPTEHHEPTQTPQPTEQHHEPTATPLPTEQHEPTATPQ